MEVRTEEISRPLFSQRPKLWRNWREICSLLYCSSLPFTVYIYVPMNNEHTPDSSYWREIIKVLKCSHFSHIWTISSERKLWAFEWWYLVCLFYASGICWPRPLGTVGSSQRDGWPAHPLSRVNVLSIITLRSKQSEFVFILMGSFWWKQKQAGLQTSILKHFCRFLIQLIGVCSAQDYCSITQRHTLCL